MYRKIAFLLAAVLCMPAYAAQTKNTMKMVSYFPVPYVAYDTVSANNAMDIGVLSQCAMDIKKGTSNLGGSACSLYLYGDPNAADLNSGLLNVTAGKLDLNSNVTNARIVSKKVQIGKDMTTIGGWLDIGLPSGKAKDYDALYISSLKNTGSSFRVTSKETGAKVNSFHMFNEISNDFPGCAGTVTWKELELAADVDKNETYTDVYLVCDGTGEVTPPADCEAPNGLSYTENCPEGQEGNITFTWQGEPTCSYKKTDNCQEEATCTDSTYKASHKAECCPGMPTTDNVCYKDCVEQETTYEWNSSVSNYWSVMRGGLSYGVSVEDVCNPSSRRDDIPLTKENLQGNTQSSFPVVSYFRSLGYDLKIASSESEFLALCRAQEPCSEDNVDDFCVGLKVGGSVTCFSEQSEYGKVTGWFNAPSSGLFTSCIPVTKSETTRCKNGW